MHYPDGCSALPPENLPWLSSGLRDLCRLVIAAARTARRAVAPPDADGRWRQRRARGQRWADLLRRTFEFDVLACPPCGGRLRLIALIEAAAVIGRILRHLGLPTDRPVARPARAPPLLAVAGDAQVDLDESAL